MITRACDSCPILILLTVPQRPVLGAVPIMDARTFAAALAATALLPPNVSPL
jgi:hypothetical protein